MDLDIGCGWTEAHSRFGTLGLDINKGKADIIADAHYLPFKENVFKKIYIVRTLEYFKSPKLAMYEILRICKKKTIVKIVHPKAKEESYYNPIYLFDAFLLRFLKGERNFNYEVYHNSTLLEISTFFKILKKDTLFMKRYLPFFGWLLRRKFTIGKPLECWNLICEVEK